MSEIWNNDIEPIFSTGNIEDQFEDAGKRGNYIHLRYKKRTGKKVLTIVEGLTEEENEKYLKKWKKMFCCGGSIQEDEEQKVLQLTGDCRGRIYDFLIDNEIVDKDEIKIHGPKTNDGKN